MELIDIGVNLAHESFAADRNAVMARARAAGVGRMIVTGTGIEATRGAQSLAAASPGLLYATAGVHPHHAAELESPGAVEELRALAALPGIVAVGECGLDYYRNFAPRETQRAAFARQLELAAGTGLPVFLHERDAHADFIAILKEHRGRLAGGVAHCFTGGPREAEACLALDLHIGVTGWICDERRGDALRAAAPLIPAGRLMIETDAPYLLPRTLRPHPSTRRNEPAWLVEVARVLAELRGESVESLAAHTTATAREFFGLPL